MEVKVELIDGIYCINGTVATDINILSIPRLIALQQFNHDRKTLKIKSTIREI